MREVRRLAGLSRGGVASGEAGGSDVAVGATAAGVGSTGVVEELRADIVDGAVVDVVVVELEVGTEEEVVRNCWSSESGFVPSFGFGIVCMAVRFV